MKSYEIVVTADTNDADYIVETSVITEEELEKFKPVFDAINKFNTDLGNKWGHNWPMHDRTDETLETIYPDVDPELLSWFDECFVPHSGECGVHTIESIVYYEIPVKTKLV